MSLSGYIKSQFLRALRQAAKSKLKKKIPQEPEISRRDWPASLRDPTAFYERCFRFFHHALPRELREHRDFFSKHGRGFGEEAFHTMWFLLFSDLKPRAFLEIGVYRGQTLSLAALLQRHFHCAGTLAGISPFEAAGDSVSKYSKRIDYYADTLSNFQRFNLAEPMLLQAYSTDADAVALIRSRKWDCIYIDGNHDYEIAKADWENCAAALCPGGVIVLDDAGMGTDFSPPIFATQGHPGPSRVAQEIDRTHFQEILQVGHNRVFQKIRDP